MALIKKPYEEPVAVISDDLTGANEIGLVLAKHLDSHLVLNKVGSSASLDPLIENYAGVVVNSNTRDCPGQGARKMISELLNGNPTLRRRLIYKKIDSTLRGNLIEELEVILDRGPADVVFFVPASPVSHRFTVNGTQLVGDQPIALTEYAAGISVAGTSYLPDILGRNATYHIRSIHLDQLHKGHRHVAQLAENYYDAGIRVITCDTSCQQDLDIIRDAVMHSPLKILPIGSAALFKTFFADKNETGEAPCLIVCGSLNPYCRTQTQQLVDAKLVDVLQIDLDQAFGRQREAEINRVLQLAVDSFDQQHNLLIQTPPTFFSFKGDRGTNVCNETNMQVDQLLGDIATRLLETIRVSGLILTGGSVAAEVIGQLGANGITIVEDLHPLAPIGRLAGGPYDGLHVVTKGGGVGEPDVLVRAVHFFRHGLKKGGIHV